MNDDEVKIAKAIARLGMASEVELQAETLLPLSELKNDLSRMERNGLLRRRSPRQNRSFGDRVLLTEFGMKSVRPAPSR